MTIRSAIMKIVQQDELNFLLTNRLPRRSLTRFMGWFSRIEQPQIRDLSLFTWRFFADLDLSDARESRFRSMHDCFTRRLKDGARPVDANPAVIVSPCDAIVGASGTVTEGQVLQVKGFTYALDELLCDADHARRYRDGRYVTLRLTSSMYHRFHAPHDLQVLSVTHVPGDAWNVNPATLKRVRNVFCRNERAVIETRLSATGQIMTLVPVAAILVAGIRLRFLDLLRGPDSAGPQRYACNATVRKGEEMGWFEHGSTIILFLPEGFCRCPGIEDGATIRAGQALFRADPGQTGSVSSA